MQIRHLALTTFFLTLACSTEEQRPAPRSLAEALTPSAPALCSDEEATKLGKALPLSRTLGEPGVVERLDRLAALGPRAAHELARLLAEGPAHIRMAAATLLGGPCAHAGALPHLCRALADQERKVAMAAAYALADLKDPAAAPRLVLAMIDRARDPGLRTAAAAALVRLGTPRGVPFLLAILEAAIPGHRQVEERHGLPRKDRWALEKEIALATLRRLAGRRLGYEPEQGWEEMARHAAAWHQWWDKQGQAAFPPLPEGLKEAFIATAARLRRHKDALPHGEQALADTLLEHLE